MREVHNSNCDLVFEGIGGRNHRMPSEIHDLVMFLMWFWCSSRAPFVLSCFPSRFFVLGWFWFVLVALDRSMTWVEAFHRRKSTNSSRDRRSGQFKFLTYFWGIFQFLRFTELEFVSGHDPLEVAFLLACEPLCKVSSHLELIWSSYGLIWFFPRNCSLIPDASDMI